MIDLHTHSSASDGSFSPAGLMEEAAKRSISVIALTDHDSIGGLDEAAKAAMELGIGFIPGIELEIFSNGDSEVKSAGEFHLLGLGINRPSAAFKAAVGELSRWREERNHEIVELMNKAGMDVSYDEIMLSASGSGAASLAPAGNSIGRSHFADFMAKRKIVKNREQAFLRYLGRGRPFYIPKLGLEFEQAAALIHESGGLAVLAHPMSLYVAWGRLPDFVKNLKERGLDGLEAWHPTAKTGSCQRLEELGKKLGLYITAGSDFHGEARRERKLGITAGGKKIDETFLQAIPVLGSFQSVSLTEKIS